VLYINVAKVDWKVAHVVVMAIHVCQCFVNRTSKFVRLSCCSRKTMVASKRYDTGSGRSPTSSLRNDQVCVPCLNALKFLP
jgi:hypothetical protein